MTVFGGGREAVDSDSRGNPVVRYGLSSLAVLLGALCLWTLMSIRTIQTFFFSSDQLALPSFVGDFIHNPAFSLFTWSVPRASFLVPDVAAYFAIQQIAQDEYISIYLLAAIQLIAVSALMKWLLNRITGTREGGAAVVCLSLILMNVLLLAWPSFPWTVPFWFLVPLSHAGSMLAGIGLYIWFERSFRRGSYVELVLATLCCALLVFSDRLFLLYFSAPYLAVLIVRALYTWRVWPPAIFLVLQIAAAGAALLALERLNTQPIDRIGFNIAAQAMAIYQTGLVEGAGVWVFLVAALATLVWAGRQSWNRLLASRGAAVSEGTSALLFLTLSGLCNLAITCLLWSQPTSMLARYGTAYQFCFFLFAGLILRDLLRRSRMPVNWVIVLGFVALAATALSKNGFQDFARPFETRERIRNDFAGCMANVQLKAGLATYWTARDLSMALGGRIQIDQTESGSGVPFFWGNNATWFYLKSGTTEPVERNFIVTNDVKPDNIAWLYGRPDRELDCGQFHLWIYDTPGKIQDTVESLLASTPVAAKVAPYLPTALAGRSAVAAERDFHIGSLPSQTGARDDGSLVAMEGKDGPGFLSHGPYSSLGPGSYRAIAEVSCDGGGNRLEVTPDIGGAVLATAALACSSGRELIEVPFRLDQPAPRLEIRTYFGGKGTLRLRHLKLRWAT